MPVLRDTDVKASHKRILENKLLRSRRAIYFYALDTVGEYSRAQADVNAEYAEAAQWTATVDKQWIENLYVGFVGSWLAEYGEHVTRPKHKTIRVEFARTQLVFKHYGERGNLTTASKPFDIANVGNTSKPTKPLFLIAGTILKVTVFLTWNHLHYLHSALLAFLIRIKLNSN